MPAQVERPLIHNVQLLRFVAAAFILVSHVQHEVGDLGIAPGFTRWMPIPWGIGVDIFFIISGFIMTVLTEGSFGKAGAWRSFLLRRIARVVPPYWLFTTLMLAAALLFEDRVSHAAPAPAQIAAAYAFLPWPGANGALRPVLSLGWTLNYEIFFYAAFGLALLHRRGPVLLAAAFLLLAAMGPLIPERLFVLRFWADPIILEFIAGMGLAKLYLRNTRLPWWAALALGAAALSLLWAGIRYGLPSTVPPRLLLGAGAFGLCAAFMLLAEPRHVGALGRSLRLAGDASYALYLSHPFTINLLAIAWQGLELAHPLAFITVASLAAIGVAIAVHLLVEGPLIRFARARLTGPRRRAAAAAAP